VSFEKQVGDRILDRGHLLLVLHRERDGRQILTARYVALVGRQGDKRAGVHIGESRCALLLEHADDREHHVARADALTGRVDISAVQILGKRRSEHDDLRACPDVAFGEERSICELEPLDRHVVLVDAVQGSVGVGVARDQLTVARHLGSDAGDERKFGERGGILTRE